MRTACVLRSKYIFFYLRIKRDVPQTLLFQTNFTTFQYQIGSKLIVDTYLNCKCIRPSDNKTMQCKFCVIWLSISLRLRNTYDLVIFDDSDNFENMLNHGIYRCANCTRYRWTGYDERRSDGILYQTRITSYLQGNR